MFKKVGPLLFFVSLLSVTVQASEMKTRRHEQSCGERVMNVVRKPAVYVCMATGFVCLAAMKLPGLFFSSNKHPKEADFQTIYDILNRNELRLEPTRSSFDEMQGALVWAGEACTVKNQKWMDMMCNRVLDLAGYLASHHRVGRSMEWCFKYYANERAPFNCL